jgi:hypothetical protein
MTRRRLPLVAASLLVVLAAGCGGGGSTGGGNSAADFVQRVTTEFSRGQSGRLWDQLLPADQRVTTRARFLACQPNEGWALKSIKVFDTYSDPVVVGGKTVPATAVSVRVTSDDGITTATMHAVSSGGHWHWVLQPSDRSAYVRGVCPRTG